MGSFDGSTIRERERGTSNFTLQLTSTGKRQETLPDGALHIDSGTEDGPCFSAACSFDLASTRRARELKEQQDGEGEDRIGNQRR